MRDTLTLRFSMLYFLLAQQINEKKEKIGQDSINTIETEADYFDFFLMVIFVDFHHRHSYLLSHS